MASVGWSSSGQDRLSTKAGICCRSDGQSCFVEGIESFIFPARSRLGSQIGLRNLSQKMFQRKKRFGALALPDQMRPGPVHHDLGRARPAVVVGTHAHGVGAGRHDRQQIALAHREFALACPESRRFRTPARLYRKPASGTAVVPDRHNVVLGLVQRRANQVVHGGIDHGEISAAPCLRYSMRVSSTPALPTRVRPGSSRSFNLRSPTRANTSRR